MTDFVVTTSNWNDPNFWSAITETAPGHSLFFNSLPGAFTVNFDASLNQIVISDGTSTFTVGDSDAAPGADATLGGTTDLDFFTNVVGTDGSSGFAVNGATPVDDTIVSGAEDDTISGGEGNDSLDGGAGDDLILGGAGNDTILGQDGNDTIVASEGDDLIDAGEGDDFVTADNALQGADTIAGGGGNDTLQYTDGAAQVLGGRDDDRIVNIGATTAGAVTAIDGGFGVDTFVLDGNEGTTFTSDHVVDLSTGALTFNGVVHDTLSRIENIELDQNAAGAVGDDNANLITAIGNFSNDLDGGAGNDTIDGGGGDDSILGGEGDDSILAGEGDDGVSGGVGNDTIFGSTGADRIDGGDGDDSIFGGTDNDTILGGGGDDTIFGGQGDDEIRGDAQSIDITQVNGDAFQLSPGTYQLTPNAGDQVGSVASADTIRLDEDFSIALDINLGSIDANGADGIAFVFHNDPSGELAIGASGDGLGATGIQNGIAIQFDTFTNPGESSFDHTDLRLTENDTPLTGATALPNLEDGAFHSVQISWNATTQTLSWVLDGEPVGTYTFPASGPGSVDDVFGGPEVFSYVSASTGGFANEQTVSNLSILTGPEALNDGNDVIDAGDGNDTVFGDFGNDSIDGGTGNDVLLGGTGDDTILGSEGADVLEGGDGNDDLIGGIGDDTLLGGDGDDRFVADDGNDTIVGGEGNDTTFGGAGDDTHIGGAGDDQLNEVSGANLLDGGAGNDTIIGGADSDTILGGTGNDTVEGGDGNDSITADAGADIVGAGDGNDTVFGGSGSDTLSGDMGDDRLFGDGENILIDNQGFETDIRSDGSSSGSATDWIITGSGGTFNPTTANFTDEAPEGNNTAFLNTGASISQTLATPYDSDQLYSLTLDVGQRAGTGDASYTVNIFAGDTIIATTSGDLSEADNFETVNLMSSDVAGNPALNGEPLRIEIINTDGIQINIDDVMLTSAPINGLNSAADSLLGGDGEDFVDGGFGDDTLEGGRGDDTILGGAGNDRLEGNDGNDQLSGGAGNDTFSGGEGNDTIDGGIGDDVLRGNNGEDVIMAGDGNDTVLSDDDNDTVFAGAGDDSVQGGSGDDIISGEAGIDLILGEGGNDTLIGGAGDDLLIGGAGNDTFVYSAGDGLDRIADFNAGNTGALNDSDSTNNDFIDLSLFYDNISELHADQADDGILNQSNTTGPDAVDYSNNAQFATGEGLFFLGATPDNNTFTADNTGVVCFTSGTAIRTPDGDIAIEDLNVGDLVSTLDNGPQRIHWIGTTTFGPQELADNPRLRPVRIKRGVLGAARDLLVSPQHGMVVADNHLARATHLAETMRGVHVANGKKHVTYVHMMFETHQIVFAENAPSESFYPGPMALKMMSDTARQEVFEVLPGLDSAQDAECVKRIYGDTARTFVQKQELSRVLAETAQQTTCDAGPNLSPDARRGALSHSHMCSAL